MSKRLIFTILLVGAPAVLTGVAEAGALVGHWKFDGDLSDSAGTATGVFNGGQAGYEAGKVGQAVSFDGVDDFVNIPSPANPAVYTIAVWVKPARTDAAGIVTRTSGVGPSSEWSHQLRIQNGVFHHYLWVGAERNLPGMTTIVPDTWYHVVIVAQNSGPMRLYVDGEEDGTSIGTAGTLWAAGDRIHVGSNSGHSMGWFQGLVDDLRIYNRELTAAQVGDLRDGIEPTFVKAEKPVPADGTIGVAVPLLQWTQGETAVLHDVYIGTTPELGPQHLVWQRYAMTTFYYTVPLQPATTYFWRIDEIEKDGVTTHTGDVWTFMTQDLVAYHPSPAHGANDAAPAPDLTWLPGQNAVKHHLYFSDSLDAVTQGAPDADKGERALADANFAPGTLESLKTHYWRVDEVLFDGVIRAGAVWSFTTYLPVDDFESYNDEEGQGTRIYETWSDGWVNNNGATVGNIYPPFAERTIVHEGVQSMPLDYNNVVTPFYSEAVREFALVQDWTVNGADALVLYVRGRAGNGPAAVYVTLEDGSKRTGTIAHPDPGLVTATRWTEWKIPLSDFTGVNPAKVKKIGIGLGDRNDPVAGGAGRIYIDDIRVVRPVP